MLPGLDRLPTLTSDRLAIRWLEARDAPAVFAIFSDPEVARYWSSPAMTTLDEAEALIQEIHEAFADRSLFQWGITLAAGGPVIGTCTLAGLDAEHRRAEVGFAVGRAHWRQGYASEAIRTVLDFAFTTLNLHHIEADVDPRNTASLAVLERLGFAREGYLPERYHVNGEIQDSVLLGLLRHSWLKAR